MGQLVWPKLGLGAAIIPHGLTEPAPSGTVLRDIAGVDLTLPIGIVRRNDGVALTPVTTAFLEALGSKAPPSMPVKPPQKKAA